MNFKNIIEMIGNKKLKREIERLGDIIQHMGREIKQLVEHPDTFESEIIKSNYLHKDELEYMMWVGDCKHIEYRLNPLQCTNPFPSYEDWSDKPPLDNSNCDGGCSQCKCGESDNNNV